MGWIEAPFGLSARLRTLLILWQHSSALLLLRPTRDLWTASQTFAFNVKSGMDMLLATSSLNLWM